LRRISVVSFGQFIIFLSLYFPVTFLLLLDSCLFPSVMQFRFRNTAFYFFWGRGGSDGSISGSQVRATIHYFNQPDTVGKPLRLPSLSGNKWNTGLRKARYDITREKNPLTNITASIKPGDVYSLASQVRVYCFYQTSLVSKKLNIIPKSSLFLQDTLRTATGYVFSHITLLAPFLQINSFFTDIKFNVI
jgi:hypothetical protein